MSSDYDLPLAFRDALPGAAIGGIYAALATGDGWTFVLALVACVVVGGLAGFALIVAGEWLWGKLPLPLRRRLAGRRPSGLMPPNRGPLGWVAYFRVLVLSVAAAVTGVLYASVGAWLTVIALVLLLTLILFIVFAILALLSGR